MPSVKIVLKLLCQNVDDGHQCQVHLRRSMYEVDGDIEEIKIPLQAIIKLKRIAPLDASYSSSMLPMSQRAQLSLPVISKLESGQDERKTEDEGESKTSKKQKPRARKSIMKETKDMSKESDDVVKHTDDRVNELKELKALLMEMKERLQFTHDSNSMEVQKGRTIPRKSSVMMDRPSVGINEIRSSEASNCPFVQYLLTQHESPEGNIDISLPISAIIGPGYALSYKRDTQHSIDAGSIAPEGLETKSSESGYPNSTTDNSVDTCNLAVTSCDEDFEKRDCSIETGQEEEQNDSVCSCERSMSEGLTHSCVEKSN